MNCSNYIIYINHSLLTNQFLIEIVKCYDIGNGQVTLHYDQPRQSLQCFLWCAYQMGLSLN